MNYVGSHVWKVRQKMGHDELIVVTVDAVAVKNGKVCLVYNKDFDRWAFPGGHAEIDDSWQSAARTEMIEEAGLVAEEKDLVPFATVSGSNYRCSYPNGDKIRPFTLVFLCENFAEQDLIDTDEIREKRWLSFKDARKMPLSSSVRLVLDAYEKYAKTGVFQQIII